MSKHLFPVGGISKVKCNAMELVGMSRIFAAYNYFSRNRFRQREQSFDEGWLILVHVKNVVF